MKEHRAAEERRSLSLNHFICDYIWSQCQFQKSTPVILNIKQGERCRKDYPTIFLG